MTRQRLPRACGTIVDLPMDLIELVATHIRGQSMKSFSLACRTFALASMGLLENLQNRLLDASLPVMQQINTSWKRSALQFLNLRACELSDRNVSALLACPRLLRLRLEDVNVLATEGSTTRLTGLNADTIELVRCDVRSAKLLDELSSTKFLSLEGSCVPASWTPEIIVRNSKLEKLNLSGSSLGDRMCKSLGALSQNSHLLSLKMDDVGATALSIVALSNALKTNRALKSLSLRNNIECGTAGAIWLSIGIVRSGLRELNVSGSLRSMC